jgi:RNA polymerase sigma-70 factor (ECF subfamily)
MNAMMHTMETVDTAADSRSAVTDEELLRQYRETGDRDYFAELVSRYERELYSYLKRYLGHAEMAEDVFQASFLQVHLKAEQFAPDRRFRPWLYAIATNQAIDAQRRHRRQRMVSLEGIYSGHEHGEEDSPANWMVSHEPSPGAKTDEGERDESLRRAMSQLTDQMRLVIHLVYYQGLMYREAAEVMAVPVGTIKSRLHAAVAKLTEFWNQQHAESD